MFVESLAVEGFAALNRWEGPLGRVVRLDGPPRALAAVSDALLLLGAVSDRAALATLLSGWGVENPELQGGLLPEGATWSGPPLAAAVAEADGLLRVSGTIRLDPPLYGRLRKLAARDPRLVDALGADATLTLKVGARFSPGYDAVAVDLLAFLVGNESFPVAGKDRPDWLPSLLAALSGRIGRAPLPESGWVDRARRWDAASQRALRHALAELGRVPTGPAGKLDLLVMPEGLAVLDGDRVVPLRQYGPEVSVAAGLVGAVHLSGAEVLILHHPPKSPRWRRWLAAQAEADGSALEQLVILGDGGVVLG